MRRGEGVGTDGMERMPWGDGNTRLLGSATRSGYSNSRLLRSANSNSRRFDSPSFSSSSEEEPGPPLQSQFSKVKSGQKSSRDEFNHATSPPRDRKSPPRDRVISASQTVGNAGRLHGGYWEGGTPRLDGEMSGGGEGGAGFWEGVLEMAGRAGLP